MNTINFTKRIEKHYPHLRGKSPNIMNDKIWEYVGVCIETSFQLRYFNHIIRGGKNMEFYGNLYRSMVYEYIRNNIDMINLKLL